MPYKILTLDGGGAWALIEVKALIDLFGADARGNTVLQQFDMVAANSGGSIVLGGLVEDMTLSQMLDLFMDQTKRTSIFSPSGSIFDKVLEGTLGLGPKYSAANKLPALEVLMPQTGNTPMSGITANVPGPGGDPVRLLIVGFDYDRNRATFFRSVQPGISSLGVANPASLTLAEAIHASTNAPVNYFDAPAAYPERPERYWDGGITGNNNPVLIAVAEALNLGIPAGQIAALSLGTGTVHLPPAPQGAPASPYTSPYTGSGLAGDIGKLAASILDDPPDASSFLAHIMTKAAPAPGGEISRVVRANPLITPVGTPPAPPGGMTVAQFQALCGIGMDAIPQAQVNAIAAYADLWLQGKAPNQLLHTNGVNGAQDPRNLAPASGVIDTPADFGHAVYPAARAAWLALSGMVLPPPG